MTDIRSLVQDVVASPLGDVIAAVGQGVADAQHALDQGSLAAVLEIYTENDDEKLRLLQEIGYRPTFYALPETTGEVRIALRLGGGAAGAGSAQAVRATSPAADGVVRAVPLRSGLAARFGSKIYATPVDAGYANQFGYSADISAKLTFKIVPVPAPEGADELRLVPDLSGRAIADASQAIDRLGLRAILRATDGTLIAAPPSGATVQSQSPAPGQILRLGNEVTLTLQ